MTKQAEIEGPILSEEARDHLAKLADMCSSAEEVVKFCLLHRAAVLEAKAQIKQEFIDRAGSIG